MTISLVVAIPLVVIFAGLCVFAVRRQEWDGRADSMTRVTPGAGRGGTARSGSAREWA